VGVWTLKAIRRGLEIAICPICRKEEELRHILECERTKGWRGIILEKKNMESGSHYRYSEVSIR
jgi:hypothetical protein